MPIDSKKTAQSLFLDEVKGADLDDFLAKGWYRMGPTIFTTHYIFYENQLLSTIWLRTHVAGYTYPKSLRKLLRKNKESLTYKFEAFEYTSDLEQLYQKYRLSFKGRLPMTLKSYMMDSLELGIYDTWLVKVYAEGKLIAYSIFDLGENSLSSIFGCYDPTFSNMSLGLYTMLLEIEFAKERDMQLYYIGYFVPGNSRFDYKLRVGNIEYLDFKTREWLSYDQFDYEQTPIKVVRKKLEQLHSKLGEQYGMSIHQNAFIDAHTIEFFPRKYLEDPFIIKIDGIVNFQNHPNVLICIYDLRLEAYKLYHCEILDPVFSAYNPNWLVNLDAANYKNQLLIKKTLKTSKTIAPIERWLSQSR